MLKTLIRVSLLSGAVLLSAGVAQSREMYRYYDAEGKMVVDYHVPAKYVGSGYEVLNEKGIVTRVVPRELTEEEKAQRDVQEQLRLEAEAEAERLREWDESLLLRYSTIADIEDARERALRELRIRVSILKSNKRSLKQRVENYQSQAADLERRGEEVDVERWSDCAPSRPFRTISPPPTGRSSTGSARSTRSRRPTRKTSTVSGSYWRW
jgi:hypothetical protein